MSQSITGDRVNFPPNFPATTYDPEAIKLHHLIVEIFNLLKPPFGRAIPEEVWERRVGSVELERPRRFNNGTPENTDFALVPADLSHLHLRVPVQGFIHNDAGAVGPDLEKRERRPEGGSVLYHGSLTRRSPPPSYLAPDDFIAELLRPLDEDVVGQASLESRVRVGLVA